MGGPYGLPLEPAPSIPQSPNLSIGKSVFRHRTSDLSPPTSDLSPPTSVLRHLTSVLRHPTSVLRHPTSVSDLRPPTSVLRPPTSDLSPPTSDLCPQRLFANNPDIRPSVLLASDLWPPTSDLSPSGDKGHHLLEPLFEARQFINQRLAEACGLVQTAPDRPAAPVWRAASAAPSI
jgi:hypothetical protein